MNEELIPKYTDPEYNAELLENMQLLHITVELFIKKRDADYFV